MHALLFDGFWVGHEGISFWPLKCTPIVRTHQDVSCLVNVKTLIQMFIALRHPVSRN
jgi:hypothetical protein